MATITTTYAASAAVTITLASLAHHASWTTGRESNVIDNTSNKYVDALLAGKVTVGTGPTAYTTINVYVFALQDDSNYPDAMDGTDSGESVLDITGSYLRQVGIMYVGAATSDKTYYFGPVSVAQAFGGVLPPKWGVYIAHNTGQNLNSTAGNHAVNYIGVKYDVA